MAARGWLRIALLCAVMGAAAAPAYAFTFSDGTTARCTAGGQVVPETDVSQSPEAATFTGKVVPEGEGYRIYWNMARLGTLPPAMHDYLFYHECAHARVPTRDETMANCSGLQDMRAAGKAGPDVEARIAAFYGAGSDYWARTLRCADRAQAATVDREAAPPTVGEKPPSPAAPRSR